MCPVGAVSKMMRVKCAYSGLFVICTTRLMATASSTPGGSVSSSSPAGALLVTQDVLPCAGAKTEHLVCAGQRMIQRLRLEE